MNSQTSSEPVDFPQYVDRECEKHGPYKARSIPSPFGDKPFTAGCPKCSEEAAERRRQDEKLSKERARIANIDRLVSVSGIPARYLDATIDGFVAETLPQRRVRDACQRFVDGWPDASRRGASAIFCGPPGTGKTHMACAVGLELVNRYFSPVAFHTALSAIRSVKETYRSDSHLSEGDAIARLINPSLLILDEIGVQVGSDHERMLIFEIINERYQQCRSTILISNLNKAELGEYLGDRIMDRFRECGGVLAFDWASHRGAKR